MLLWPPKGSLCKFTLRLKGDLCTTHPPTHNDTKKKFKQIGKSILPKFAIGLEGPTKLKNWLFCQKPYVPSMSSTQYPPCSVSLLPKSFHLMMIRSAQMIHLYPSDHL
jgi:hypothetical protein